MKNNINLTKIKVVIETITGRSIWGHIFLSDRERMQDLLNDDRKFIPILLSFSESHIREDSKVLLIHKDSIATIEER